ncbi:MAG: UDP-N-acetylmuramoyl-tripeptide--D-alanyl-D-alanine ligase [Verrucomicrobiota bacterium]
MEPRSLKYLTQACEGELRNGSPERVATSTSTDSRRAGPGDLFFALAGDRFDAHSFLPDVAKTGVVAVVADAKKIPANFFTTVIQVDDTRKALGNLGARYRRDFDLPIVAVAGSNGKTTTKELLASVLRQKFKTHWSEASFNNDIGVPVTLLKLETAHQAAVLEVGTNHPGELAPLLKWIRPQMGVITSIGREHLEYFGDLAGVAKEEGELAEALPADGVLFVNGESELIESVVQRTRAKVVRVGFKPGYDCFATDIQFSGLGVNFHATSQRADLCGEYRLKLLGRHQVSNALLALSVAGELGLSRAEIQRGLAECEPAKMRLQTWVVNGIQVLDDSYNANADSMLSALATLRDLPCVGRRVAVLGDMAELGDQTLSAHTEVGQRAACSGIDHLFSVGKMARVTADSARAAGLRGVTEISDVELAGESLKKFLKPGDVVLLKASRATRIERIGEMLRN